ncbi:unnamed protein product [Periconia digitata]|uniref:Uncharacterized protein n=1 Tax=Periconia digitata TaxID=1303443 RepID=A0A9W4XT32_9PLEO|nr:unnamed protein product [Periconia digitata]
MPASSRLYSAMSILSCSAVPISVPSSNSCSTRYLGDASAIPSSLCCTLKIIPCIELFLQSINCDSWSICSSQCRRSLSSCLGAGCRATDLITLPIPGV